jgi:hypothetical protein
MPYLFAAKGCRITSTTCFSAASPDPPKVVSRRRRKEGKKNVSDTPKNPQDNEPVDFAAEVPDGLDEPTDDKSAAAPLPALPSSPRALPSPQALSEHVGVSDNAISDVKQLIPANGDAGVTTVLLAAIGVAGGGAAWKFYSQHSKNKHNERMKELELQAASQQQRQDDNHEKCSVERAALEAKVSSLESRLVEAERRANDAENRAIEAAHSADKAAQAAQAASKEPPFSIDDFDGVKEKIVELEKKLAAKLAAAAEKKPRSKKS